MVIEAESGIEVENVRTLFLEYAASLGFSLCFQNFNQELEGLPGAYKRPDGRLLLALLDGIHVGCVAFRRITPEICEMKRLYVRPESRAAGVGRSLAEAAIAHARDSGYIRMRLDTIEPLMAEAVALYRKLGFREIAPYTTNPLEGALYLELQL